METPEPWRISTHFGLDSSLTIDVIQANLRKRTPSRPFRKEKRGGVISNEPVFSESYGTGYGWNTIMKYAANAEGILRFVFCAIWHLVVKWAKAP